MDRTRFNTVVARTVLSVWATVVLFIVWPSGVTPLSAALCVIAGAATAAWFTYGDAYADGRASRR